MMIPRDEGKSVLIVTHDPRVEDIADRVLWLEDGALKDRRRESHNWIRGSVCGMRVDHDTATDRLDHQGRQYVFCSQRCLERFRHEPDRYAIEETAAARGPAE